MLAQTPTPSPEPPPPEDDFQDRGIDEKADWKRRSSLGKNMWGRTWDKVENWLKKEAETKLPTSETNVFDEREGVAINHNSDRKIALGQPRIQTTFQRQDSERRDRLLPYEPDFKEKRAQSADRRAINSYFSSLTPVQSQTLPSQSAPDVSTTDSFYSVPELLDTQDEANYASSISDKAPSISLHSLHEDEDEKILLQSELEAKWIVNLSMFFKDHSAREKFFVTYALAPNNWKRLSVSCDYRNPEPDSLEAELRDLLFQREKSARLYEAIRESLPDIQYYSTVTNLKIKTIDGRLHIHCSEDLNEIIKFPHLSMLAHIPQPYYKESELEFGSHISGFVYKVNVDGTTFIKKEIPGPDSVDEFIYEVNALANLQGSQNVIQFQGLVVDDDQQFVKGLLVSYASQGALVEMVYDSHFSNQPIPWSRRENWARQIIIGLAEIHEAGFVQGDFTLSNIVLHEDDRIALIDINRRGCPMGWEPPELLPMIHSGQRISMFIGVKTDLYQLGMVLWAIAMMQDEPDREPRPLREINNPDVPQYFHDIVDICLQNDPRRRLGARYLLQRFPSALAGGISDLYLDGVTCADGTAPSETYFNSKDSGIAQDETRTPSPMKFTDEDETLPVLNSFSTFASFDSGQTKKNSDSSTVDETVVTPPRSPTSESGMMTPRPSDFKPTELSMDGILQLNVIPDAKIEVEESKNM
jgi:serine/threonine protein kinase